VGRPKISTNPIELLKQSVGPEAFENALWGCCCFVLCIIIVVLIFVAQPILQFAALYPKVVVVVCAITTLSMIVLCFLYGFWKARLRK
jgi:hypothetical protein